MRSGNAVAPSMNPAVGSEGASRLRRGTLLALPSSNTWTHETCPRPACIAPLATPSSSEGGILHTNLKQWKQRVFIRFRLRAFKSQALLLFLWLLLFVRNSPLGTTLPSHCLRLFVFNLGKFIYLSLFPLSLIGRQVYPSVSRKVLVLFKCQTVGPQQYVVYDSRLLCGDQAWISNALYALACAILYIIGVPLLFFKLPYEARNDG